MAEGDGEGRDLMVSSIVEKGTGGRSFDSPR